MPGTERAILFVDRSSDGPQVAIWYGDPPIPIEPAWLAVTLRLAPSRQDKYVLYWLSAAGEVFAFDQCDVVEDALDKARSLGGIASNRWRHCDLALPDAWVRIPRASLVPSSARTEAEVLARAIEIGALSVADAVAWADSVIEREDHPDSSICEVAMSARKYEPDVVAALREVPGKLDEGEVKRRLVRVLSDGLEEDHRRADQVARSLYRLALANQVDGEHLRNIAWWAWDGLDLADAGMVEQTREQVIDEMIAYAARPFLRDLI